MDEFDLQREWDREDEETRRQVYANNEARGIVVPLLDRWAKFTALPAEPDYLNPVLDAVLAFVDEALNNGTPRAEIPGLAEKWFPGGECPPRRVTAATRGRFDPIPPATATCYFLGSKPPLFAPIRSRSRERPGSLPAAGARATALG